MSRGTVKLDEQAVERRWPTGAQAAHAAGWTQEVLAQKAPASGVGREPDLTGKLEAQLRRVPDCELLFLAKVLGVAVADLLPANPNLKKLGPQLRR